eukprot:SAG11_NODE_19173_length_472_cov_2.300268_1_plen_51_part_10
MHIRYVRTWYRTAVPVWTVVRDGNTLECYKTNSKNNFQAQGQQYWPKNQKL